MTGTVRPSRRCRVRSRGCTGWRYVAEELAGAGITAHLAEPADTAFARGRKRHAKTDKTDSRHLRMLLAEGRLPECWIPPGRILECRALLELYNDLRRERTAWSQRIHAVLFHPSVTVYRVLSRSIDRHGQPLGGHPLSRKDGSATAHSIEK